MGGPGVNHNLQTPYPLPFPTQTPELGAQTDPPPLSLFEHDGCILLRVASAQTPISASASD